MRKREMPSPRVGVSVHEQSVQVLTQRHNQAPHAHVDGEKQDGAGVGAWPAGQQAAPSEGQPSSCLPLFPTWAFGPVLVNFDLFEGHQKSDPFCEISGCLSFGQQLELLIQRRPTTNCLRVALTVWAASHPGSCLCTQNGNYGPGVVFPT